MKNQNSLRFAFTGLGAILFNTLFWNETMGLNTVIYAIFLTIGIGLLYHHQKINRYAIITGVATLFATAMVVVNFSFPARLALIASSLLTVGFLNHQPLRSLLFAISGAFSTLLKLPKVVLGAISFNENTQRELKLGLRYAKLFVIPILFLAIFLVIFKAANPVFNEWTDQAFEWIGQSFGNLFEWLSPIRLLFLLLGAAIASWVFFSATNTKLIEREENKSDDIIRKRNKRTATTPFINPVSLKNENRVGLILMAMVSVMAAVVNGIDIFYVWFNFEFDGAMNLSQFVHEGTYLLILSILLSMGIMLYFFRGSQNFYLKNTGIKWLATIWIIQNVVMVISVGIRNYHYIAYYGLAYKRIGVIFFLGLTLFGLFTLYFKIKNKKSTFFLLRTNSWATYAMVLILSMVNWDNLIASYNIEHWNTERTDVDFLLSLSDKALPILDQHRSVFEGHTVPHGHIGNRITATQKLDIRIQNFVDKGVDYSWFSWTWPEGKAFDYFNEKGIVASVK